MVHGTDAFTHLSCFLLDGSWGVLAQDLYFRILSTTSKRILQTVCARSLHEDSVRHLCNPQRSSVREDLPHVFTYQLIQAKVEQFKKKAAAIQRKAVHDGDVALQTRIVEFKDWLTAYERLLHFAATFHPQYEDFLGASHWPHGFGQKGLITSKCIFLFIKKRGANKKLGEGLHFPLLFTFTHVCVCNIQCSFFYLADHSLMLSRYDAAVH